MKAVLLDAGSPATCHPVTCARSLAACPVANRPLAEQQAERLRGAGLEMVVSPPGERAIFASGDAWLSGNVLKRLLEQKSSAVVLDAVGYPLAWIGNDAAGPEAGARIMSDEKSFRIRYPWDLLRINEELVGALAVDDIRGEVSPAAHVEGRLILGGGSRILPGVVIEGNVVIGAGCKIGPNCYLRGNTSIGDNGHIGQAVEIKNSLLMRGVSIGHLSYCGDSIVGEKVNFGAGTITANFRHDGASHRSMALAELVDTGRRKFGAIIGDGVHTGIHTSIYPGRKIWPGVETRPGAIVQRDLTA